MKRKLLSAVMILVLTLSLAAPAFGATFPDLEGHWAEGYMEDLADRGYLKGYDDGTMGPENSITVCESLVFLSRLYTLDEIAMEALYEDYGSLAEEIAGSSRSWAYENIAICLAAGIVSETELRSLKLNDAIEKELLAVFLVRAMQMEDLAFELDTRELTFDDTSDITSAYRGHVMALVQIGIIEGNEKNQFTPKLSVTRAVVATMVSRALDYLESENVDLTIEAYDGIVVSEGIIASVTSSAFRLRGYDGLLREYPLDANTTALVGGTVKNLSSTYVGCYTKLTERPDGQTILSIEYEDGAKWVQGILSTKSSNNASTSQRYLTVIDAETGTSNRYLMHVNCTLTQSGSTITYSQLTKGNFLSILVENNYVTQVRSGTEDISLKGTITSISYGSTVTLKMADSSGETYVFLMDILDLPTIYRGDIKVSIDRLNIGDEIEMEIEDGAAQTIYTAANEASAVGTVTSITTNTSGTTWTILSDNGDATTCLLDVGVVAYSGTKTIDISSISVGDKVSVVVYSGVITEVYLESPYSATNKINVTVLAINTSSNEITALNGEKLVYIDCSNGPSIIAAATGTTVKLSTIENGASLLVYGAYSATNVFQATSIIIEA